MFPFLLTIIVVILLAHFTGVLNILAWILLACFTFVIIRILITN